MKHSQPRARRAGAVLAIASVIALAVGCRSDDARGAETAQVAARETVESSYVVHGPFLDAKPLPIIGPPSPLCTPLEITLAHKNLPKCVAEVRFQCAADRPSERIVVHLQAFDERNEMLYESWEEAQEARAGNRGEARAASTADRADGARMARFHVGRDVGLQMNRVTLQFLPY
jgi:hypothetical protein